MESWYEARLDRKHEGPIFREFEKVEDLTTYVSDILQTEDTVRLIVYKYNRREDTDAT